MNSYLSGAERLSAGQQQWPTGPKQFTMISFGVKTMLDHATNSCDVL